MRREQGNFHLQGHPIDLGIDLEVDREYTPMFHDAHFYRVRKHPYALLVILHHYTSLTRPRSYSKWSAPIMLLPLVGDAEVFTVSPWEKYRISGVKLGFQEGDRLIHEYFLERQNYEDFVWRTVYEAQHQRILLGGHERLIDIHGVSAISVGTDQKVAVLNHNPTPFAYLAIRVDSDQLLKIPEEKVTVWSDPNGDYRMRTSEPIPCGFPNGVK